MVIPIRSGAIVTIATWCQHGRITTGRNRCKDRIQPFHIFVVATDHETVSTIETPDTTAGAAIDKPDTEFGEAVMAVNVIAVIAIAPIDDYVSRL
jgi:hypothetical protein